jgi:hypothetical protein
MLPQHCPEPVARPASSFTGAHLPILPMTANTRQAFSLQNAFITKQGNENEMAVRFYGGFSGFSWIFFEYLHEDNRRCKSSIYAICMESDESNTLSL